MSVVIQFIQNMKGIADVSTQDRQTALIISSGAQVWLNNDYPDGSLLNIQYPGCKPDIILTAGLMPVLIAEHARLEVLQDGGKERTIYHHLTEHFEVKTGL